MALGATWPCPFRWPCGWRPGWCPTMCRCHLCRPSLVCVHQHAALLTRCLFMGMGGAMPTTPFMMEHVPDAHVSGIHPRCCIINCHHGHQHPVKHLLHITFPCASRLDQALYLFSLMPVYLLLARFACGPARRSGRQQRRCRIWQRGWRTSDDIGQVGCTKAGL